MANRNEYSFVKNLAGCGGPLLIPGPFQAGSTQAIYEGMLLKLSGGYWVPLTADESMAGVVGVAHEKVEAGDLAGYRMVIVPRVEDVFRFTLLSTDAQNPAIATAVYVSAGNSDSFTVTTTAGSNKLGTIVGWEHYPQVQGHQSQDASFDRGTTISSVAGGEVMIAIERTNSYYSALFVD